MAVMVAAAFALGRASGSKPTIEELRSLYPQIVSVDCVRWTAGGECYETAELAACSVDGKAVSGPAAGKDAPERIQIRGTVNEKPFAAFLRVPKRDYASVP